MLTKSLLRSLLIASLISSIVPAFAQGTEANSSPLAKPAKVMVWFKQPKTAEAASTAIAKWGRVEGRLRGKDSFRIELKTGVDAHKALSAIRALPGVLAAAPAVDQPLYFPDTTPRGDRRAALRKEGLKFGRLDATMFRWQQRAYPKGYIDAAAIDRARQQRDAMPGTRLSAPGKELSLLTANRWDFLGPRNYGGAVGTFPFSGRINAVAYHPTVHTTFYVGASSGGVWKTTDNGVNWTCLSDDWASFYVSAIATAPNDVVYVGTGDYNADYSINGTSYGNGVMRSIDGGNTWTQLGVSAGLKDVSISDIVVDPGNPAIVTISTGHGRTLSVPGAVWRSTDSGNTWTKVITIADNWSDLAIGPLSGGVRRYYAVSENGLLYVSTNSGATWTPLASPLASGGFSHSRVAAHPTMSTNVYLLDGNGSRVFRSTNSGTSWTDITGNFPANWGQSWYDATIAVARPAGTDHVWVGLITLALSTTAGGTWSDIGQVYGPSPKLHPDVQTMTFKPGSHTEGLVGGDGGVYRFTYDVGTGNLTMVSLNANLGVTEFYHMDVSSSNFDDMIGGTQDNGTPQTDSAASGVWDMATGGDGGYSLMNPSNSLNQYSSYIFGQHYKTNDAWSNVTSIQSGGGATAWISPMVFDALNPNLVYTAQNRMLNQYTHNPGTGGGSMNTGLGGQNFGSDVLAIAARGATLYVGTQSGGVWRSSDTGATWTQIDNGTQPLPARAVTSISINPLNASSILVTLSGTGSVHVFQNANTSGSGSIQVWTGLGGTGGTALPDVPTNGIARDVDDPANVWHVATDIGVFSTFNAGGAWSNSTNPLGLPNVECSSIQVRKYGANKYVYVSTWGRGIWRLQVPSVVTPTVSGLSLSLSTIKGGQTSTGTVTLSGPAPAGGTIVSLNSTSNVAQVPNTVTVGAGLTTANFTVTGVNNGPKPDTATIQAGVLGTNAMAQNITVNPNNNASFVSFTLSNGSPIPASMVAGVAYGIKAVFNNTGGTTWKEAFMYRMMSKNPNNNTTWGMNRLKMGGAQSYGPGQTWTFYGDLIAPETAGAYNMQWKMVQDTNATFGIVGNEFGPATPNFVVNSVVQADAGRWISQTVPTTVTAGADFNASMVFRNTGSNPWPAANYYLMSRNPNFNAVWGYSAVYIPTGVTVAPLTNHTFSRTFIAPSAAGTYGFRWSLHHVGFGGFGSWNPNTNISVVNGPNNATFVSQVGVPTTIAAGATFNATITMSNAGTGNWTGAHALSGYGPNPNSWTVTSIPVPGTVLPGNSQAFNATFTAPSTPGTYRFQWRMKTGTTFFGQPSPIITITVT